MVEQTTDRYERFRDWCAEVGIKAPKLRYPAYFDGGLCGVMVTEDIVHNEAMFRVPYRAIMSVAKAKAIPELAHVFGMHPGLFGNENDYGEPNILFAFLLYEK
jgi:hypothetical protein